MIYVLFVSLHAFDLFNIIIDHIHPNLPEVIIKSPRKILVKFMI